MFNQNKRFRTELMSTRGMMLYHTRGESNPYKTILTENELCSILMNIRSDYDKRKKNLPIYNQTIQEEKYPIPVSIGDLVINIAVTQSSEEYYSQAVKIVNEEILKYQNVYPDANKEQLFAVIAIENLFK